MIWFLGNIAERISTVSLDGVECPAGPIREGARVIGVLPDDLKRLYILLGEASRKKEKVERETVTEICEATEDGPDHATRSFRADVEHQTLVTCFWESVKETMPETGIYSLSLAENWQVVTSSPLPQDQMSARFARMQAK